MSSKKKKKVSILYTHGIGNPDADTMTDKFHGEVGRYIKDSNIGKKLSIKVDKYHWRGNINFDKSWRNFISWAFKALPILFIILPIGSDGLYVKRRYSPHLLTASITAKFLFVGILLSISYYFIELLFLVVLAVLFLVFKFFKPKNEDNILNHIRMASATNESIDKIVDDYKKLIYKHKKSDEIFIVSHSQGSFITYETLKDIEELIQDKITWISVGSGLKPLKIMRGLQGHGGKTLLGKLSLTFVIPVLFSILFSLWFTVTQKGADFILYFFTLISSFILPEGIKTSEVYSDLLLKNLRSNWEWYEFLAPPIYILIIFLICSKAISNLNEDGNLYKPIGDINRIEWIEIRSKFDLVSGFHFPLLPERVDKASICAPVYSSRTFDHVSYFKKESSVPYSIFRLIVKKFNIHKPKFEYRLYQREQARNNSFIQILIFISLTHYLSNFYFTSSLEPSSLSFSSVGFVFNVTIFILVFKLINQFRTKYLNSKLKSALLEENESFYGKILSPLGVLSKIFYLIIYATSTISASLAFSFSENISKLEISDINTDGRLRQISDFKMGLDQYIPELYFINGNIMTAGLIGILAFVIATLRFYSFNVREGVYVTALIVCLVIWIVPSVAMLFYGVFYLKLFLFVFIQIASFAAFYWSSKRFL